MQHNVSLTFLQTIKASIMTNNNALVSVILADQFNLDMMVPQRTKQAPKASEGIPVSLPVTILETQNNTKYGDIMGITV